MSEKNKKTSETVFDQLKEEQKAVQIPYYVHEMEMTRLDRINKRIWIILIVIFLAFVGTNAGWIIYESQFETVSVHQEVDSGEGPAVVSGTGNAIYGESEANGNNPSPEDGR